MVDYFEWFDFDNKFHVDFIFGCLTRVAGIEKGELAATASIHDS